MKKNNTSIIIFIAFLFLIGFFNLIQNGKTIINYIEYEEIDIISIRDGSFFVGIEEEFSDNFIFKEIFMKISNNLNNIKGLSSVSEVIDTQRIAVAENWTEDEKLLDIKDDQINENYSNAENDEIDKDVEEFTGEINENTAFGSILIYEEKGMELNTYNPNSVENYVKILNGIAENIDEINVYSMLIPTQVEFIDYKKINEISYSQKKVIDETYSNFENIETIDVYEILKENKDDYIFFKTDHHWTQSGAYYAYREFAETIEDIPKDISYFEKIEIENFLGSLHRVTGNVKLEENPDYITVYKDELNPHIYNSSSKDEKISSLYDFTINFEQTNNKYGVFLGGDKALMYIEGKTQNS